MNTVTVLTAGYVQPIEGRQRIPGASDDGARRVASTVTLVQSDRAAESQKQTKRLTRPTCLEMLLGLAQSSVRTGVVTRRKTRIFFLVASLALCLISLATGLTRNLSAAPPAGPGSLDTSFGIKGKLTTNFSGGPDAALSVAVQPVDGKIIAAGYAFAPPNDYDFALARYNTNGSLDISFGGTGKVTTDFADLGGGADFGAAMVVQGDGKIVLAGTSCHRDVVNGPCIDTSYRFALARYNTDGSLDTAFGSGGKVLTDLPATKEQALAVALQSWDIVVAGYVFNGSNYDFALARYNMDGSLDTLFGSSGIVTTDFSSRNDLAVSLALQSDDRIVVVGQSYIYLSGVTYIYFALARYNMDGSLDTTFGSGGEVTTDFYGHYASASAVVVQSDGRILAAGYAYNTATRYDFALARYNIDGTLDTSFGSSGTGKVTTDFGNRNDIARGLVLQSNGKIVAVGGATVVGGFAGYDFALARYNSTGTLDPSFGSGGKVTTDFNHSDDFAVGVAIQPIDGKIAAAGYATTSNQGGTTAFGLARYWP